MFPLRLHPHSDAAGGTAEADGGESCDECTSREVQDDKGEVQDDNNEAVGKDCLQD